MKLAIVGSRNFKDYERFCIEVEIALKEWDVTDIEIISGGADGADALAERYSREVLQREPVVFPADWNKYGKSAGPKRNTQIVDACTHMIAFPSHYGKGTQDSVTKIQKAKKPHKVIFID